MARLSVTDVIDQIVNDEMDECDSDEDFDGYIDDEETERILHKNGNESTEMDMNDEDRLSGGDYEMNDEDGAMEYSDKNKNGDDGKDGDMDGMTGDNDSMNGNNDDILDGNIDDRMYGADNDVIESDGANGDDDGMNFENDVNRSTVSPGTCTVDMTNKQPVECFRMLVTEDILENIVDETNLYADQFFASHGTIKPRSLLHMEKKDFQYG